MLFSNFPWYFPRPERSIEIMRKSNAEFSTAKRPNPTNIIITLNFYLLLKVVRIE